MFHRYLILITFLCSNLVIGQTTRGSLGGLDNIPCVDHYLVNNKIDLVELRKTTDFLTNRDIKEIDWVVLPKRKKAFIRHIKHISEKLENYYLEDTEADSAAIELLLELELFKSAFIHKGINDANSVVTTKDVLSMAKNTWKSRKIVIEITDTVTPLVVESPYWHEVKGVPNQRFGELAKEKKIKAHKKQMFILFDDLSYSGSAPKVRAMDMDLDNEWNLKWGDELHSDVAGSRLFAALGYDVDHPYYYSKDKLFLIFDSSNAICNWEQLRDSVFKIFQVDVNPYLSGKGIITDSMAIENDELIPYVGKAYVTFIKCGIEGRPDRVKRIGPFLADTLCNEDRTELKAALLAHAFIGNWDTREVNTLLTTVHDGNYNYRISAAFSDLGTSFGVRLNRIPSDFKTGLVNEFDWEVVKRKGNKIIIKNPVNAMLIPYQNADYNDLRWMAMQIAELDSTAIRKCLKKGKWPGPIEELYFHKLASRRASILKAFEIEDPHPIEFDRKLTIEKKGKTIIRKGKLVVDYKRKKNPESFLSKKGRKRNYGN